MKEAKIILTLASNNPHKLEEIRQKLNGTGIKVLGLSESGIQDDLPENGNTLEANAYQKANRVYSKHGLNCFADDTGLEVKALNGEPGVFSARYAGEKASFEDNMKKLLREMEGKTNREAQFRTVISLILGGKEVKFEGAIRGYITDKPRGTQGFGYDPVFVPEQSNLSFAEMDAKMKNQISHRALATEKLVKFLKNEIANQE